MVVVAECRDLLVGGVVTAGAGVVGVPADGGARYRLRGVMHEIVSEGGDDAEGVDILDLQLPGRIAIVALAFRTVPVLLLARRGASGLGGRHVACGVVRAIHQGDDHVFVARQVATAALLVLATRGGLGRHLVYLPMPVVAQGRDLRIGGVVTAGACVVGVPADGGARYLLRVVMHEVVPEGRQLHVGGVAATGTGVVGSPADGRAGGRQRVVVHDVVAQRVHVGVVVDVAATGTGVGGVALLGAGGRGDLVLVVMALCREDVGVDVLDLQLAGLVAEVARALVAVPVLRLALLGAGGGYGVVVRDVDVVTIQHGDDGLFVADGLATQAFLVFQARGGLGGREVQHPLPLVVQRGHHFLGLQYDVAHRTMRACGEALLGAGGGHGGVGRGGVPRCRDVRIHVTVLATGAGVGGVALRGAGGRGDLVLVVVAEGREGRVGGVVATATRDVGVPTDGGTGGRLCLVDDDVVAEGGDGDGLLLPTCAGARLLALRHAGGGDGDVPLAVGVHMMREVDLLLDGENVRTGRVPDADGQVEGVDTHRQIEAGTQQVQMLGVGIGLHDHGFLGAELQLRQVEGGHVLGYAGIDGHVVGVDAHVLGVGALDGQVEGRRGVLTAMQVARQKRRQHGDGRHQYHGHADEDGHARPMARASAQATTVHVAHRGGS